MTPPKPKFRYNDNVIVVNAVFFLGVKGKLINCKYEYGEEFPAYQIDTLPNTWLGEHQLKKEVKRGRKN